MEGEERGQDIFDLGNGKTKGTSSQLLEKLFPLKPLHHLFFKIQLSTLNCLQYLFAVNYYFNPNLPISPLPPRIDSSTFQCL